MQNYKWTELLKDDETSGDILCPAVENYMKQVHDMYENEGCWPGGDDCLNDTILTKIAGNPIYSYQVMLSYSYF